MTSTEDRSFFILHDGLSGALPKLPMAFFSTNLPGT
jgi:hypothetical protein